MKTAILTHFDGDPFLLYFWLYLYKKYWRGEVDTIYLSFAPDKKNLPPEVLEFQYKLLDEFKEIQVFDHDKWIIPELGNQIVLPQIKEDLIGLIESDGYIFDKGLVKGCFDELMVNSDVVGSSWDLVRDDYIVNTLGMKGLMRCFLFIHRSILENTDCDFLPRTILEGFILPFVNHKVDKSFDVDCFGWMSIQIACQTPKITWVLNNMLNPENITDIRMYDSYNWLHVRQMMSSTLGINSHDLWGVQGLDLNRVFEMVNENYPDGTAEFTYMKSIVFRLLFLDIFEKEGLLTSYFNNYRIRLETTIDILNLPRQRIYELKGYFKGLMRL